jgi:hypothetical protein
MKCVKLSVTLFAVTAFCSVSVPKVAACTVDFTGKPRPSIAGVHLLPASMERDDRQKGDDEAVIVGLWNTTVTSVGTVILRGFEAYHTDHTEVLNEFHDPRSGNVCLGVWKHVGRRTYQLKHPAFWWDANGNWIGYRIIRQTVTVNEEGNEFSGTWSVDRLDTDGNPVSHTDGEIIGTRVTVD